MHTGPAVDNKSSFIKHRIKTSVKRFRQILKKYLKKNALPWLRGSISFKALSPNLIIRLEEKEMVGEENDLVA